MDKMDSPTHLLSQYKLSHKLQIRIKEAMVNKMRIKKKISKINNTKIEENHSGNSCQRKNLCKIKRLRDRIRENSKWEF